MSLRALVDPHSISSQEDALLDYGLRDGSSFALVGGLSPQLGPSTLPAAPGSPLLLPRSSSSSSSPRPQLAAALHLGGSAGALLEAESNTGAGAGAGAGAESPRLGHDRTSSERTPTSTSEPLSAAAAAQVYIHKDPPSRVCV